jgi:hypothetical protein
VEQPLEAPGELLTRTADEGANVSSLKIAVAVDQLQDRKVAVGHREAPVPFGVTVGLWDELPESVGFQPWHLGLDGKLKQ